MGRLRQTQTACMPSTVASILIPFGRRQATLESGWQENLLQARRCLCIVCILPLPFMPPCVRQETRPHLRWRFRAQEAKEQRHTTIATTSCGEGRCGKHQCTSSPNAGGTKYTLALYPGKGCSCSLHEAPVRGRFKAELRASFSAPMSRMGRPLRHCLHLIPAVQTIDMKTLWSEVTERPQTNFHSEDPLGSI